MGESQKIMQVRSARQVPVRVRLMDDDIFNHSVDKRAVGWILFDKVCEHLNILEKDYFGMNFYDATGEKYWLNNDKKIAKQLKGQNWDFNFEVKFYPADPSQLAEDLTRYQLCLQIRRDIVNERLPCSFVTYTLLGSYTAQSELGDYDTEEFGSGYRYLKDIQFAPHQDKELLMKIAELHRQHKGQTPEEAELHFLENAKKLAMCGVELHPAKDAEGKDIQLGVCASGLIVYKDKQQVNRFVWPKVLKISYRRNKYYIKIRPGEFETFASLIGFKCPNVKFAKRLWKISVEHHSFFRFREPEVHKSTSFLPRFGSRFRYSGRTQFQTRQIVAEENRDAPYFDRVLSKRGTFSGRTDNMRKRDEDRQRKRDDMRRQPNPPQTKMPPSESPNKPPPEPKRTPPEPKHAPPVAPKPDKPRPHPRGPPSVDDNVSIDRDRGSLNDSFDDVPDRRSKMEKIHAVATPLAALMQSKKEHDEHVEEHHREEESRHRDRHDDDHEQSFDHEVGKSSQTNPTNCANQSNRINKAKGAAYSQVNEKDNIRKTKSKSVGDNFGSAKGYVFSYPASSYESVTSHGDYNASNDCLDGLNKRVGSTQNLRYNSQNDKVAESEPLSHSVSAEIVYSDIPKNLYDEIGPSKSEGIYAEIDDIKSQVDKIRNTQGADIYSEISDAGDKLPKHVERPFADPKIHGRRSKYFKENQKLNSPNKSLSLESEHELYRKPKEISHDDNKSKPYFKNSVQTKNEDLEGSSSPNLLGDKLKTAQLPIYAKINKQNKRRNNQSTNTSSGYSETCKEGNEVVPSSNEGTMLKEELKMYILTPEKVNSRNSDSGDFKEINNTNSDVSEALHKINENTDVKDYKACPFNDCLNVSSENAEYVVHDRLSEVQHKSEITSKAGEVSKTKTEPSQQGNQNEMAEPWAENEGTAGMSFEQSVKVLSLSSLEDSESVHNTSSVVSDEQGLISEIETEEIELDVTKRFESNSLSCLYKLTFDDVSNNGAESLHVDDDELERFSALSNDSSEFRLNTTDKERPGHKIVDESNEHKNLPDLIHTLDDELERFSTVSTDSSEFEEDAPKEESQHFGTTLVVPPLNVKSKKKKRMEDNTTESVNDIHTCLKEKRPVDKMKNCVFSNSDTAELETVNAERQVSEIQTRALVVREENELKVDENVFCETNEVRKSKNENKMSFEIENYEQEPYSRKRYNSASNERKYDVKAIDRGTSDEVTMDFFQKPKLKDYLGYCNKSPELHEIPHEKQNIASKNKAMDDEFQVEMAKEIKDRDKTFDNEIGQDSYGKLESNFTFIPFFKNKEIEISEEQQINETNVIQNDTSEREGSISDVVNEKTDTPVKPNSFIDKKGELCHIDKVKKRLEFFPKTPKEQHTNTEVPVIKGSKVFNEGNLHDRSEQFVPISETERSVQSACEFSDNETSVLSTEKTDEVSKENSKPLSDSRRTCSAENDYLATTAGIDKGKNITSASEKVNGLPSNARQKSDQQDVEHPEQFRRKEPDTVKEINCSNLKNEHPKVEVSTARVRLENSDKRMNKDQKPYVIKGSKVFTENKANGSDLQKSIVYISGEYVVKGEHCGLIPIEPVSIESIEEQGDKEKNKTIKIDSNSDLQKLKSRKSDVGLPPYHKKNRETHPAEHTDTMSEMKDRSNILPDTNSSHASKEKLDAIDEIAKSRKKSNETSDLSFESTSTSDSNMSENAKHKKKISPGVIHMLNPCPSGWIEGGLKSSTKTATKKKEKTSKYTVSVLDFNPHDLPKSNVVSAISLDSDLTALDVSNKEMENSDRTEQDARPQLSGTEILENAQQTDLLCQRVWKTYLKGGRTNIQRKSDSQEKDKDDDYIDDTKEEELRTKTEERLSQDPTSVNDLQDSSIGKQAKLGKSTDNDGEVRNYDDIKLTDTPKINIIYISGKTMPHNELQLNQATDFEDGTKAMEQVFLKNDKHFGSEDKLSLTADTSDNAKHECNSATDKLEIDKVKTVQNDSEGEKIVKENVMPYNEQQSLHSKLQALGLGDVEIDEDAINQQTLELQQIDYNSEEQSDSDSGPSETDSESGDEIELASFEMPGLTVNPLMAISDGRFSNTDVDETQQFAIDCSFENVKSYKMGDKTEQDVMSILCECNFQHSGNVQGIVCQLHKSDRGDRNASDLFKTPDIIDDTPYVPVRSNLKTKAKSDSSLLERRVRFDENLPVYKSSSNLVTQKHLFAYRKDDSEKQNMKYIEDFITCMFDEEPRNIGLAHSQPDNNKAAVFETDDLILPSDGTCGNLENPSKRSPKIVKPVSGKRPALVKVSTQQRANENLSVVIKHDQHRNDSDNTTPMILFTSPTGEVTHPDKGNTKVFEDDTVGSISVPGVDSSRSKLPEDEAYFKPYSDEALSTFIENEDGTQVKNFGSAYSTVGIAELKEDSDSSTKKVVPDSINQEHHNSPCQNKIQGTFNRSKSGVKDISNWNSKNYKLENQSQNSGTDLHMPVTPALQDSEGVTLDSSKNIRGGNEVRGTSGKPREEITRYTFSVNEASDSECPKIKTVTYEYITEYKLNNVKVQYQQNRKTQTDPHKTKTSDEGIATDDKDEYINGKVGLATGEDDTKMGPTYENDTKIVVEEVIEKSVCYPLGPSHGKPSYDSHELDINGKCEEEIEKTVTVVKRQRSDNTATGAESSVTANSKIKANSVVNDTDKDTAIEGPIHRTGLKVLELNADRDLQRSVPSSSLPNASNKNDLKIIEHDSKKYVWQSLHMNIPFQQTMLSSRKILNEDSLDEEAKMKRNWTLCDDYNGEHLYQRVGASTRSDLAQDNFNTPSASENLDNENMLGGINEEHSGDNSLYKDFDKMNVSDQENVQGKDRLRQFCKRKLLKRNKNVEETFPGESNEMNDSACKEQMECESNGALSTANGEEESTCHDVQSSITQRRNPENSGAEGKESCSVAEHCYDGETLFVALMQERLPEINVHEHTNETLFVVQAVAAIALGTVLVFLLPYMG